MNNKFIRILIIINGILIPIFIGFLLVSFIISEIKSKKETVWADGKYLEQVNEFEVKYDSPKNLPNSENYYVAIQKIYADQYNLYTGDDLLNQIPSNTSNIIFLDKNFNVKGKILSREGSILNMYVPKMETKEENSVGYISYFIADSDTNSDDRIDRNDQHYVYLSDLNGENLKQISDRKVSQYKWINDNSQLLLTFKKGEADTNLEFGVYDVGTGKIEQTKSLNNTE